MYYPMRSAALPRRRYSSPYNGFPAYGLLDTLDRPDLVRVSDLSESSAPSQPRESAGISPMRWLAGQVGLLDLLAEPESVEDARVPISTREPEEPGWFDRAKARLQEMFPPVPPPEMVRDDNGGVWRKDIHDLIEDIATAEPEDEPALRQRIQEVLSDFPHTRDFWFHYELANRLDGDDSDTVRTALRDRGHEMSIQARELMPQLLAPIALGGKGLSFGGKRSVAVSPAPSSRSGFQASKSVPPESSTAGAAAEAATSIAPVRPPNRTRFGIRRDSNADWRKLREQWDELGYGEILSPTNRSKIGDGFAPVVDETWVKFFPEDAGLLGKRSKCITSAAFQSSCLGPTSVIWMLTCPAGLAGMKVGPVRLLRSIRAVCATTTETLR